MFRNIKLTIRNLRRNGVYSVVNIVGLAMSLATCVFIVLWVQDERSYDRFHRDAENIYMAVACFKGDGPDTYGSVTAGPFASTAKENFPTVEDYCRIRRWEAGYLRYNDVRSASVSYYFSDSNFFDFFNFPIVKGNREYPLRNPTDAVITEKLAGVLFGKEDPIGKTVSLNDGKEVTVSAVMKDMPRNTYLNSVDMVCSHELLASDTDRISTMFYMLLTHWGGNEFSSFIKVKPDTDVALIAQQITELQTSQRAFRTFSLQPLVNLHLYNLQGEPTGMKTVRLFQWIALIILVIACINYVNLVTARASKRHKEIGLKKVVGAKKWQLFLQLISEAVILFAIAILTALVLNVLLTPAYEPLSGKEIVFRLFDLNVWLVYATMLVAVVVLAGMYPAYLLSSFRAATVVQTVRTKRGSNLFRKTLVVIQFVASTALIAGTIALGLQMKYIREKNMGYDRENVLICSLRNISRNYDAVKAELEQHKSILGVTAATSNIMTVGSGHAFSDWEGKTSEGNLMYTQNRVDTSYLRVMGITLVAGTNFTTTSERQYIINETTAKTMGLTDPVGKWAEQPDTKIVGVVKDFHFKSLHQEIEPFVMYYAPDMFRELYVRVRPGNVQQAIAAVENVWKQYNPDYAFDYSFMDDTFDRIYKSDIRTNQLFGIFSIIAILISCLGLFGLIVFTAEQKTKEIGIRKVLGASILDIVKLLTTEFLILVGIAILIAIPLAYWWLDNMLQEFAYRISLSWWMFFVAALITVALTLLTVSAQAIRAANANPVKSLKIE